MNQILINLQSMTVFEIILDLMYLLLGLMSIYPMIRCGISLYKPGASNTYMFIFLCLVGFSVCNVINYLLIIKVSPVHIIMVNLIGLTLADCLLTQTTLGNKKYFKNYKEISILKIITEISTIAVCVYAITSFKIPNMYISPELSVTDTITIYLTYIYKFNSLPIGLVYLVNIINLLIYCKRNTNRKIFRKLNYIFTTLLLMIYILKLIILISIMLFKGSPDPFIRVCVYSNIIEMIFFIGNVFLVYKDTLVKTSFNQTILLNTKESLNILLSSPLNTNNKNYRIMVDSRVELLMKQIQNKSINQSDIESYLKKKGSKGKFILSRLDEAEKNKK